MKKLVLFILLGLVWCSIGYSKINEVYYCEMDKTVKTVDDQVSEFKNQKFKFKREQNIIKFGSGGFFNDYEMPVIQNTEEYFWGGDKWSRFIYLNGKFVFSNVLNIDLDEGPKHQIRSIVATCDLF